MMFSLRLRALGCAVVLFATIAIPAPAQDEPAADRWYFPPPGEGLEVQRRVTPREAGLDPEVIEGLRGRSTRWALWRYGSLVHVEGDFNHKVDVASLRKTWHAMTVGAAIQQGRIPSLDQRLTEWGLDLTGRDAEATWRHVITQSSGFDFPHPDFPEIGDPRPGTVWTYSDKNPVALCNALARVYGKRDFRDDYDDVLRAAYFDAIGMRGWSTRAIADGIRLQLDLEDMGRLGLLACARGRWGEKQIVPAWFVEQLETKQTAGMRPVYNGPDDGNVGDGWWHERRDEYPEAPYGFMTWANTDRIIYPGADAGWAYGAGRGGRRIYWNHRLGIVFAGDEIEEFPTHEGIPHVIEGSLLDVDDASEATSR